ARAKSVRVRLRPALAAPARPRLAAQPPSPGKGGRGSVRAARSAAGEARAEDGHGAGQAADDGDRSPGHEGDGGAIAATAHAASLDRTDVDLGRTVEGFRTADIVLGHGRSPH